jgi:hypothetical protein
MIHSNEEREILSSIGHPSEDLVREIDSSIAKAQEWHRKFFNIKDNNVLQEIPAVDASFQHEKSSLNISDKSLENLPNEVLFQVAEHLAAEDVMALSAVNRSFLARLEDHRERSKVIGDLRQMNKITPEIQNFVAKIESCTFQQWSDSSSNNIRTFMDLLRRIESNGQERFRGQMLEGLAPMVSCLNRPQQRFALRRFLTATRQLNDEYYRARAVLNVKIIGPLMEQSDGIYTWNKLISVIKGLSDDKEPKELRSGMLWIMAHRSIGYGFDMPRSAQKLSLLSAQPNDEVRQEIESIL